LVFHSSTITMMYGPINIRYRFSLESFTDTDWHIPSLVKID